MADEGSPESYREVLLQIEQQQCPVIEIDTISSSDVTIKTDGHVKSASGGGFGYKGSSKLGSLGRNRFIYWRISKNVLELSEESLDVNLLGNVLKIHFQNASLLPNVEIFETTSTVIVLAATTNSVHRFIFSNPSRLQRHDFSLSPRVTISIQSILSDANLHELYKPWNCATFSSRCTSFSGWLCQDGHCLFSLITTEGTPLLVKLPPLQSQEAIEQFELKQTGVIQRLWSGLVPSRMRGDNFSGDSVSSVVIHPVSRQTYVFTLCRDYKIRVWNCQNQECVTIKNLVDDIPDDVDMQSISGQTHLLRKSINAASQSLYIGVFLCFAQHVQFSIYEVVNIDGEMTLANVTNLFSPKGNLVDFVVTTKQIWTLWMSHDGIPIVEYAIIESSQPSPWGWTKVSLASDIPTEIPIPDDQEPRETYLDYIFYPGRFSKNTIDKAIKIFDNTSRRSSTTIRQSYLKEQVIALVDAQVWIYSMADHQQHHHEHHLHHYHFHHHHHHHDHHHLHHHQHLLQHHHHLHHLHQHLNTDVSSGALHQSKTKDSARNIQSSACASELLHEEFSDLQLQMWSRFYACVVQYHEAANKPLGLFVDVVTGFVAIIRKEAISFLRPCDDLETLYCNPVSDEMFAKLANTFSIQDHTEKNDFQNLVKCIQLVTNQLTREHMSVVEIELTCGYDPTAITQEIAGVLVVEEFQANAEPDREKQFVMQMEMRLQKIQNLVECVENILDALDAGKTLDKEDIEDSDTDAQHLNLRRLFASSVSVRILSSSLGQQSATRISLCRDLLILMHIVTRLSARAGLHSLRSYNVTSTHIPRLVYLLRTYHSLHWLSQQSVLPTPPNALESNLKQLAALEISDVSNVETAVVPESMSCTILELFLSGSGGHQMRMLLPKKLGDVDSMMRGSFKTAIFNALDALNLLLWPNRSNVFFPEYLATKGQFHTLLEYCFVLGSWCTRGRSSRSFLQGQAHLVFGDYSKAFDCFVEAIPHLDEREPLFNKLLLYESDDHQQAVQCYVKVMRLFEQFGAAEFVLKVADVALSVGEKEDRSLPIIWSNIFKHHLELGHNDDAYAAITANPDIERKRDCLHRFVVVLCEREQRQELVEYPYVNLVQEVVSIIEYHARTVDIATHTYYQLLYAFHTFRGNYRKAASSMYEYGMRLAQELPGLPSLQKQAKCYLTAMNSLRLLDPKNHWIVKPMDRKEQKNLEGSNMSPKRKQGEEDGEESYTTMIPKSRRRVTVLEIGDLEKEYMLVLARLQLLQKDTDPAHVTGPSLSPDETLVLLVQAGLYDTAFSVASAFGLPLTSIFDGLAARCVKLSLYSASSSENPDERMAWLKANDTGDVGLSRECSPGDQAWRLLNVYLDRFGSKKDCVYFKCVSTRLLSMGCPLPTWLVKSYKIANPAELFQLLINFDMLQEATSLALQYLNAMMGHGKEYFGIEESLNATSSPVWFPYVALDQLVAALDKVDGDETLYQLRDELRDKIDEYLDKVARVSNDMVDMKWKNARMRMKPGAGQSELGPYR